MYIIVGIMAFVFLVLENWAFVMLILLTIFGYFAILESNSLAAIEYCNTYGGFLDQGEDGYFTCIDRFDEG